MWLANASEMEPIADASNGLLKAELRTWVSINRLEPADRVLSCANAL
jgi:hypothetical protein